MLTPYSVQDTLNDPRLEAGWALTLSEWEDAAHSQIQATLAHSRGLRNQILNVTREMDSMEELERILALCYIDLKCQWSILNAQIQYAAAHRGEIREDLMYRATCVSQLLDRVEGMLSQTDVDAMTEMISEPIGSTAFVPPVVSPAPAGPYAQAAPPQATAPPPGTVFVARPQAAASPSPQAPYGQAAPHAASPQSPAPRAPEGIATP